ncbi:MAG TPA: flavin reductase family protein [Gaiellaceae bacterium]|nr:flavin reductase family protein [Gaiellaceae bacterium]
MSDYAEFTPDPRTLVGGYVEADPAFGPARPATVDEETFKAAMRSLAAGVVMVVARREERLWGLTISACCSISANPPQILISLANDASCLPAVLETRRFGLSVLREDQKHLAELGAVPGGPKYVDAFCDTVASGRRTTTIAGALVHLDCSVHRVFEVSDHTLLIGNVEAVASPSGEAGPLVYFDRTFHALGEPVE